MAFIKIASLSEVPPGALREFHAAGMAVAVCNVGGQIRVLDGACPHLGGPLGYGNLENETIVCPWHAWEFDAHSGECRHSPLARVESYAVRIEDGHILADLPIA